MPGSKVMAAAAVARTTRPAATPIDAKLGMPLKARPLMPISTQRPAKTTAWPAVPIASATASSGVARGQAVAMPGDDQQRVVDADAQAEHAAERGADGVGYSTTAASRPISPVPTPMPIPAINTGNPAAITDPNASTKMTSATPMPIVSATPFGPWIPSGTWPPTPTWRRCLAVARPPG